MSKDIIGEAGLLMVLAACWVQNSFLSFGKHQELFSNETSPGSFCSIDYVYFTLSINKQDSPVNDYFQTINDKSKTKSKKRFIAVGD